MEKKIEELKEALDFTRGELDAVKFLTATLLRACLKVGVSSEMVLPGLARLIETDRQDGQQSSAYLAGMEQVHKDLAKSFQDALHSR